tara:strand:- start:55 stop:594 length:540 start_codon:yes stop_codon:yes gene_type:complete
MHNFYLKKYYFINRFNKNNIDNLSSNTAIIYRNYSKRSDVKEIIRIKNYCKIRGIKVYLSNDIKLSIKLGFDGAYIPSFNKSFRHLSFSLKKDFNFIGSAHNLKQMRIKESQKVKNIFLSSIFKKNKNYLGLIRFSIYKKMTRKEVIALGGISKKNIKKLKIINCVGFAGISYFQKKRP